MKEKQFFGMEGKTILWYVRKLKKYYHQSRSIKSNNQSSLIINFLCLFGSNKLAFCFLLIFHRLSQFLANKLVLFFFFFFFLNKLFLNFLTQLSVYMLLK
jgi:hypothetical protein